MYNICHLDSLLCSQHLQVLEDEVNDFVDVLEALLSQVDVDDEEPETLGALLLATD